MSVKTTCGHCGREIHPADLLCPHCGARFRGFVDLIRNRG